MGGKVTSPSVADCSKTTTWWPSRASAMEAAKPPSPAPTIAILKLTLAVMVDRYPGEYLW